MFGIIIAFKDYRNNLGIFKSKWVGLDNFKFFFSSLGRMAHRPQYCRLRTYVHSSRNYRRGACGNLLYEVKRRAALQILPDKHDAAALPVMGNCGIHNIYASRTESGSIK